MWNTLLEKSKELILFVAGYSAFPGYMFSSSIRYLGFHRSSLLKLNEHPKLKLDLTDVRDFSME